jgi:hypothetical protein
VLLLLAYIKCLRTIDDWLILKLPEKQEFQALVAILLAEEIIHISTHLHFILEFYRRKQQHNRERYL